MSEWKDISTAPKDGSVFMGGTVDGLCSPCCICVEPPKGSITPRLWGLLPPKIEREGGGTFIYFALPKARGFARMTMRQDGGWEPTHWQPLPEAPQ